MRTGIRAYTLLVKCSCLILIFLFTGQATPATEDTLSQQHFSYSIFPILMYDSDIGLGFGGKALAKNIYHRRESLDLTLFASSKGEQWYVFQFSIPDYELRQGEAYPLAWDFKLEWDKLLKSNFFGIGNNTADNDYQFPKEFFKLESILGHAFSRSLIIEIAYRFTHYSVYDYDLTWGTITPETPGAQENNVSLLQMNLRYDSRDSQIHPHRGMRLMFTSGVSHLKLGSDWNFTLYRMEWSVYRQILGSEHILAARLWIQQINGNAPYPELSKIGDSWTARGYKANRFLDKAMNLISLEYRFPLYKRLGGVLFTDAGRVMSGYDEFTFTNWHSNWGWGLRYYLTNFVVRFDMGISKEGSRIFFNFGHVF